MGLTASEQNSVRFRKMSASGVSDNLPFQVVSIIGRTSTSKRDAANSQGDCEDERSFSEQHCVFAKAERERDEKG